MKNNFTNQKVEKFAIIGAAGYVAPRHMQAIHDTGNILVAAMDPSDSVGILDKYFPEAHFFTEFERFDRHIDLLRRSGSAIDYVSITSPNYLHDSHVRFGLRSGANVICEKPLVLNPHNIESLMEVEAGTNRKVSTILQLRLHPSVIALREKILLERNSRKYDVELTYITSRGQWYSQSWKGVDEKSGGIATNIGIHFFDMLHYIFGALEHNVLHHRSKTSMSGYLEYERARVQWFLSVNSEHLPAEVSQRGMRTFRSIKIDGSEFEFSDGFTNLHTKSYQKIISGEGFGLSENKVAIQTAAEIRELDPISSEKSHYLTGIL